MDWCGSLGVGISTSRESVPKMSTFERLVRAQQVGVYRAQRFPVMRFDHLKAAILGIHDKEIALAFKLEYIEFTKATEGQSSRPWAFDPYKKKG